ncbi:MAG: hypothetical protein NC200_02540 [Candidatus Gastranaerophilales bacterium]|nr:hypothetical protein [Candidatus Gastranaerophilales bacterium]
MGKLKLYILISIVCFLSIVVMFKQPDMHKQAMITDSEYSFIEEDLAPANVNVKVSDKENIDKNISIQNIATQENKKQLSDKKLPMNKTVQQKQNVSTPKTETKSITKPVTKPDVTDKPVEKTESTYKEVKPRPKQTVAPVAEKPKQELTEQEEIIAWNRWRSALQNQVMRDSEIAAPLGTRFKFSFTVDKYGNMSNVKVWSETPCFSDMAVRIIKPVLMSYQHKAILNFPKGTKRTITNVNGGFVISRTTQYSTPSDYNDYERVRR